MIDQYTAVLRGVLVDDDIGHLAAAIDTLVADAVAIVVGDPADYDRGIGTVHAAPGRGRQECPAGPAILVPLVAVIVILAAIVVDVLPELLALIDILLTLILALIDFLLALILALLPISLAVIPVLLALITAVLPVAVALARAAPKILALATAGLAEILALATAALAKTLAPARAAPAPALLRITALRSRPRTIERTAGRRAAPAHATASKPASPGVGEIHQHEAENGCDRHCHYYLAVCRVHPSSSASVSAGAGT